MSSVAEVEYKYFNHGNIQDHHFYKQCAFLLTLPETPGFVL